MGQRMPRLFVTIVFSLTVLAWSFEASAELSSSHSPPRLFQAETSDGTWNAGLAITLGNGWKTYWRMPGESGVPPQFDWSASSNLKAVTVGWPAPRRHSDAAGETIGYTDEVVFPLRIEPKDGARPVELELTLFYAVCKDVCIPAEAKLALAFAPAAQPNEADRQLLERFAARIPGTDASSLIPQVTSLRLAGTAAEPVLEVALASPVGPGDIDIFVEGHAMAYFRKPQAASSENRSSLFRLRIDGLPDAAKLRGLQLTLTLVSGRASLVQSLTVE
jgi:DsbC/DsbD-like thiol-disulfide interchange protein